MRTVKWYVSVGLVGCKRTGEVEVEDDATGADIEETIRDEVMETIEWGALDD